MVKNNAIAYIPANPGSLWNSSKALKASLELMIWLGHGPKYTMFYNSFSGYSARQTDFNCN
jgi:hypothetical protein